MEVIEVKTSELTGISLDWAVSKACGMIPVTDHKVCRIIGFYLKNPPAHVPMSGYPFSPSNQWQDGGPLIEKYKVRFDHRAIDCGLVIASACGMMYDHDYKGCDSYLVAACRAIVAAKLGDTVSVPKEMMQ